MLGAAAGANWQKNRQTERGILLIKGALTALLLVIVVYTCFLVFHIKLLSFPSIHYLVLMITGFAGGIVFPFFSQWLSRLDSTGTASASGSIYAWDIIGSCLGIYVTSGLIIPVYGLVPAMVVITVILAITTVAICLHKDNK